jgi:hypothetical protein
VEFKNKLWLFGDQLLESTNQWDWTVVDTKNKINDRAGSTLTIFNDRMWLIGGKISRSTDPVNDIWSSIDGINWIKEISAAEFAPRHNHQTIVWNNKLWLLGGENNGTSFTDLWSSADGRHWTLETDVTKFKLTGKLVDFKNKLWFIELGNEKNASWSSVDGKSWVQETGNNNVFADYLRYENTQYSLIKFNGKLIAKFEWATAVSEDGIHWIEYEKKNVYADKILVVSGNKLWGSHSGMSRLMVSDDGINWRIGYQMDITLPK